jgi:hypothetical protein
VSGSRDGRWSDFVCGNLAAGRLAICSKNEVWCKVGQNGNRCMYATELVTSTNLDCPVCQQGLGLEGGGLSSGWSSRRISSALSRYTCRAVIARFPPKLHGVYSSFGGWSILVGLAFASVTANEERGRTCALSVAPDWGRGHMPRILWAVLTWRPQRAHGSRSTSGR